MQGAWVQSLVGELRSGMLPGAAGKKQKSEVLAELLACVPPDTSRLLSAPQTSPGPP